MSIRRFLSRDAAARRDGSGASPVSVRLEGTPADATGSRPRSGLLPAARTVAWAAAEAILAQRSPDGSPATPSAQRCRHVVDSFAHTMGSVSGTMRMGMHGLLALLELLPVVVVRRPVRMSRLPLAERIAYLSALEDGGNGLLATLLVGVKVPMSIYAFEEGEPLARTGFDRASTTTTDPGVRDVGPLAGAPDLRAGQEVDR